MQSLQLSSPDHDARAADHLLVFDHDDPVIETLTRFAADHDIGAARFTGIGAFASADVGYFDHVSKTYDHHLLEIGHEVLSFTGNIALRDGQPRVHAHVALSGPDGSARGGHLFEARVWPTLEVHLTAYPAVYATGADPASGLALLQIGSCAFG